MHCVKNKPNPTLPLAYARSAEMNTFYSTNSPFFSCKHHAHTTNARISLWRPNLHGYTHTHTVHCVPPYHSCSPVPSIRLLLSLSLIPVRLNRMPAPEPPAAVRMGRKRALPVSPNPLFLRWLTELRDIAREKGLKTQHVYNKVYFFLKLLLLLYRLHFAYYGNDLNPICSKLN